MKKILCIAILSFAIVDSRAQMPNTLKPEEKIYGLSRFWQEVNYNFVYLNKVNRKAWDSLYVAMIPIVEKTPDDYTYYRELQRFCAFLNDGHTNVYIPQAVQSQMMTTMFGKYRLMVENIGSKAIITHTNLSIKDEIPPFSEIVAVNGLPTEEYADKYVKPYISSSTSYVKDDQAYSGLLQGVAGQKFSVKIKTPDGKIKDFDLVHAKTTEKELYPEYKDGKFFDFKWYPGQVAYVALGSFGNRKIDSLFIEKLPELYKAKALIIDLRDNGGGSTDIGSAILKYLTNDKVLYGSKTTSRLHVASFKAWGINLAPKDTINNDWAKKAYEDNHDERYIVLNESIKDPNEVTAQKIIIPTAILVSHNTASAAEDFLIYADKQKHMVKIGQKSFGSTGQPYQFKMPGGGEARVCTKKDTYPDGREFVGYGVTPDIEVNPTLKDVMKGKDPVLERALAYLKTKQTN